MTFQKVLFLLGYFFVIINSLLQEPEYVALILQLAEIIAINIYFNRNIFQGLPSSNEYYLIILIAYLFIKFVMVNTSIQNYINLSFDEQYDLLISIFFFC